MAHNKYRLVSYGQPVMVRTNGPAEIVCSDPRADIASKELSGGRIAYLVQAQAGASIRVKE
jgi:hypothetical protein